MQNFEALKKLLSQPRKIIITTHQNPDADALGSSIGLAGYLEKRDHQVSVITPNEHPGFLDWMQHKKALINFDKSDKKRINDLFDEVEVIFCLDFNALNRIDKLGEKVGESQAFKVMVDHHLEPEDFSDSTLWSTDAAATAELIYELISTWMNDRNLIDPDIANCLYAGIMTDTGQFKHPNTSKNVHDVVANLIDLGANVAQVAKLIYDNNTEDRLRFLGYMLYEKLTILKEFNTAYIAVSHDDLQRFNSRTGDTEGLVNYALSIEGIRLAVTIIEKDNKVKLSFRSVGDFSVNEFARKNFNGGGHKNAAGGISDYDFNRTVTYFKDLLPDYKKELTSKNESNYNYA